MTTKKSEVIIRCPCRNNLIQLSGRCPLCDDSGVIKVEMEIVEPPPDTRYGLSHGMKIAWWGIMEDVCSYCGGRGSMWNGDPCMLCKGKGQRR